MTTKEKVLYHQVHPAKLAIDISTSAITTYLLWQDNVTWFLLLFLFPSVIASFIIIKYANLEHIKNSALGKYLDKYMTRGVEALRFGGQIVMWVAAWYHLPILIVLGILIILSGWFYGLLRPV